PGEDAAEHGVTLVEMRGRPMRQEELAASGVRAAVRHREGTDEMPSEVLGKLIFNGIAGAARARGAFCSLAGVRIAALCHKVRNHAVEPGAIVVALLDERNEVRNGVRRFILEKLDNN